MPFIILVEVGGIVGHKTSYIFIINLLNFQL